MSKPKADPLEQAARDVRRRMAAAASLLEAPERLPANVMVETQFVRQGLSLALADIRRAQRKARRTK